MHQDKHPTHVTDACGGSNAYNEARREKIAEGIVKAKVKKLRCGYGYFLMGHRTATCIYIKGILECVAKSDSGVRQGNPGAGMMYCVGQADMLNAMVGDLHSQKMRVRIAAIVDDISMQGEVSSVAAAHKWLKDNGEKWGYILNEDVGKTTITPGPDTEKMFVEENSSTITPGIAVSANGKLTGSGSNSGASVLQISNHAVTNEQVRLVGGADSSSQEATVAARRSSRKSAPPERFEAKPASLRKPSVCIERSHSETTNFNQTFASMFPGANIQLSTRLLGAPIGICQKQRAKFIAEASKTVTSTLSKLEGLGDTYVELMIIKHSAHSWARFITSIVPVQDAGDTAMNEYIGGIDDALNAEISRILGLNVSELKGLKRAEIALPTKLGGLGIPTLQTIAPIAYTASIMAILPMMQKHASDLKAHLITSLSGDDQFGAHASYLKVREHADWHDQKWCTKAPFPLPVNTEDALNNPEASANLLASNLNSRISQQVMKIMEEKTKEKGLSIEDRNEAKRQVARIRSAGGKLAYQWMDLPPKRSRFEIKPIQFPGHLFDIALRLRMGVPLDPMQANQGRCWCKEKPRGREGRNEMDKFGKHLSACKWGSWSTKRHDELTEEIAAWLRAAGNEVCTNRVHCQDVYPRHGENLYRIIPDIVARDQRGIITTFDTMVTRPDHQANKHLFAADEGEKVKKRKYREFNKECIKDGCKSSRLGIRMMPLLFEVFGAAGKTMLELTRRVRNQYRAYVLPFDDRKDLQIFQSTWMNRLSTRLQIGTANMIFQISAGQRTSGRISKDDYLVQAIQKVARTLDDTSIAEMQEEWRKSACGEDEEAGLGSDASTKQSELEISCDNGEGSLQFNVTRVERGSKGDSCVMSIVPGDSDMNEPGP